MKLCRFWRAIGDRRGEAVTLNSIAMGYRILGETQKALEKYNEALSLSRDVVTAKRRPARSTMSARSIAHWERRKRRWRNTMKLCRFSKE